MKNIVLIFSFLISASAFSYTCECKIELYPPLTGSLSTQVESKVFDEGREFGVLNPQNYQGCLMDCRQAAYNEFPYYQLQQVAYQQSNKLIANDALGYSCGSATTYKYPVRFKASLGPIALGNVRQELVIIHREQNCF